MSHINIVNQSSTEEQYKRFYGKRAFSENYTIGFVSKIYQESLEFREAVNNPFINGGNHT